MFIKIGVDFSWSPRLSGTSSEFSVLHFEHKNDTTIVIRLHRATHLQIVALYKNLTIIVKSFLCLKCNRTLVFKEKVLIRTWLAGIQQSDWLAAVV